MTPKNKNLFQDLSNRFDDAPTMEEWRQKNIADADLIYGKGQASQVKLFNAVHTVLRFPREVPIPRVIGHHTSKSVKLPVAAYKLDFFRYPKAYALVRNNFYDTKLCVVSNCSLDIPYEFVTSYINKVYCEGINTIVADENLYKPYQKDCSMFTACFQSYIDLAQGINEVWLALEKTQYKLSLEGL